VIVCNHTSITVMSDTPTHVQYKMSMLRREEEIHELRGLDDLII